MKRKVNPEQKIEPAKFAHFVLRVRDLAASRDWYTRVLSMEVVHDAGMIVFMTYDDEHHRLALAQTPVETERKPGAPGMDHVALLRRSRWQSGGVRSGSVDTALRSRGGNTHVTAEQ